MPKNKLILIPAKPHIIYSGRPDIIGLESNSLFVFPEFIGSIKKPKIEDYSINLKNIFTSNYKFTIPNIDYWILIHFIIRAKYGYKFVFYNSTIHHKGQNIIDYLDGRGWVVKKGCKINNKEDLVLLLETLNADYNETYFVCDDLDLMISCEEYLPPIRGVLPEGEPEIGINYQYWGKSDYSIFDLGIPSYRTGSKMDLYHQMPSLYDMFKRNTPDIDFED